MHPHRALVVRLADVAPRPWRNGGGTARDLLSWPRQDGWQCRISVAEIVADGPFSAYPGVERCFAVLQGEGVELTVDGTTQRLTRHTRPLRFDGAAATGCRLLEGPTRDLNLMLRDARGRIERVVDGEPWRADAGQCALFATVEGRCTHTDVPIDVAADTLLWFDPAPAALSFVASRAVDVSTSCWIAVSLDTQAPRSGHA